MAIFPNQIKYASGAVLRNGSFKWEKMPASIKSSRSERRKGPVTVMSSFHWVTAQITGCPLGGGGEFPFNQEGGKKLPKQTLSGELDHHHYYKLGQVDFLLRQVSCKNIFQWWKKLKKCIIITGDVNVWAVPKMWLPECGLTSFPPCSQMAHTGPLRMKPAISSLGSSSCLRSPGTEMWQGVQPHNCCFH